MRDAMMQVVAHGTATVLQMPGFDVGGKTGTAEIGDDAAAIDAWMIAFAGPHGPGARRWRSRWWCSTSPGVSEATGARVAGPIAKQVLQATLAVQASGH